jgi:hypothetical protein
MTVHGSIDAVRSDIERLCRDYGVIRLDVFGSGASESEFDPARSDADFLVTFEACSPEEHFERYFGLVEALEELLQRPVDLVESTAIRNPYFARSIEASRVSLYAP